MLIAQSTWMQVAEKLKSENRVVLPLGSTEQHAGISLATDTLLAEKISNDAATPLGIPVFPALPYGLTPAFLAYPGTVSLRVSTYAALLRDILQSLTAQGFRRIALINAHGGNHPAEAVAHEWMAEHPETSVRFYNWWTAPKTVVKCREISPVFSHASWSENFPWTRVAGIAHPPEAKPMVDLKTLFARSPQKLREYLGDGNFGGEYEQPDEKLEALWQVAVQETQDFLQGPWN